MGEDATEVGKARPAAAAGEVALAAILIRGAPVAPAATAASLGASAGGPPAADDEPEEEPLLPEMTITLEPDAKGPAVAVPFVDRDAGVVAGVALAAAAIAGAGSAGGGDGDWRDGEMYALGCFGEETSQ